MAELIMQEEENAPSTPSSGKWKVYFKSNGLYIKDDTGNEIGPLKDGSDNKNVLPNGGMVIHQRGAGPFTSASTFLNNDAVYLIDGMILLSDGNDIVDVSVVSDTDFVSGYKARFDVETANKRFGAMFPIENKDIQNILYTGKASLQFKIKCTGTSMSNVRAYLLSWNGTTDVITRDVISSWGLAGSNPTFVSNWTAENTGTNIAITTTVALKMIENIAVDTLNVTNLAVLIIVDDTDASIGDFLEIGDVKLEEGEYCTQYINASFENEMSRCMRYFCTDLTYPTTPGDGVSNIRYAGFAWDAAAIETQLIPFPVRMRIVPTITPFRSTSGASAGLWSWYKPSSAAYIDSIDTNCSTVISDTGFSALLTVSEATVLGGYIIKGGWIASAEL